MDHTRRSLIGIAAAVAIGTLVALAGSDGSTEVGGVPLFALCGLLAFAVNWVVYVPSNAAQTEKYYDLTGSVTYTTVTVVALLLAEDLDARALLVGGMVLVWTLRLGAFLFRRISRDGRDGRFDEIKRDPLRFLMAWTVQGLWVLLTMGAGLAVITGTAREPLGLLGWVGTAVWLAGFAIEVVADRQKSAFKQDPDNEGDFIDVGLWAWSRHPNYFGEITLWTGVALIALPALSGWAYVTLVSPVFVAVLLTRISGIPMLERRADDRWGGQPDYEAYKDATPVLVPRPPG